jgi:hypothetical protein
MSTVMFHSGKLYSDSRATRWNGQTNIYNTKIVRGDNALVGYVGNVEECSILAAKILKVDKGSNKNVSVKSKGYGSEAIHLYKDDEDQLILEQIRKKFSYRLPWVMKCVYSRKKIKTEDEVYIIGSGHDYGHAAYLRYDDPYKIMLWCGLSDRGSDVQIHEHSFDEQKIIFDQAAYDEVKEDFLEETWATASSISGNYNAYTNRIGA